MKTEWFSNITGFQTQPVFKHERFSNTRSPRGAETRAVWIDGGIHARWGFYGFLATWLLFWCPLSSPREWIAPATATYLLGKLVETFANNDTSTCGARAIQVVMVMVMVTLYHKMIFRTIKSFALTLTPQAVDWYVAPLLNPEGYEYSHTNDRMWRKNRWRTLIMPWFVDISQFSKSYFYSGHHLHLAPAAMGLIWTGFTFMNHDFISSKVWSIEEIT